jgi:hypothetical protein
MTVHLISFASGLPDNQEIVARFERQANECPFIDQCIVVSDDGNTLYDSFYKEFGDFVKLNPRGYGFWIWKPYIILSYIKKLSHGDVLLYCDIGCELSMAGHKKFDAYIELIEEKEILAFSTLNRQPEYFWCKKELLEFFNLPNFLIEQEQVAATFFMIKVSDFSSSFVSQWLEIAKSNNFNYINDQCADGQAPEFIEHRHDQSIFSLLIKKYGISIIRERSYFPPILYYKNSWVYRYPIHALRSKTKAYFVDPTDIIDYRSGIYQFIKYNVIFFCYRVNLKIKKVLVALHNLSEFSSS